MITIDNKILNRRKIAEGVYFSDITDKRFKNDKISIVFITSLDKEDLAASAIVPRLLVQCTEKYPSVPALNRKLSELYGMGLNWHVSGEGDIHKLEISVLSLNDRFALNGEKITLEAANMLKEAIFFPYFEDGLFPAKSLETEKRNQLSDLESEINDKTNYASQKAFDEALKGEPAEHKWCGTADQIKAITPESASEAYHRMLKSANIEIVCSGGSDFSEAEKILKEAFSGIERQPEAFPKTLPSHPKPETSYITEKLDIEQSKLVMVYKLNTRDRATLSILSMMFGGIDSSKLFRNVREKQSLCYYCFCRPSFIKRYITAEFGIDDCNIEKTKTECAKQLKELADGIFTDEDMDKAKLYMINTLRTVNDTANGLLSWYISDLITDEMITPEEHAEALKSVTREDIISAAKSAVLDTVYVLTSDEKENNA